MVQSAGNLLVTVATSHELPRSISLGQADSDRRMMMASVSAVIVIFMIELSEVVEEWND